MHRAPGGRIVSAGTRDALGYTLPLDVAREKPQRALGPRPSRDAIAVARAAAKSSAFPEVRLSADDGHTQNETSIAVHEDTLVAGWNHYTDTTLLMGVARSTDGGLSWTSNVITGHSAMSDPAVRAGENGVWYYGYIANGGATGSDFDVFVRRSTDAGSTWQTPVAVTVDANFDDKPYIDASGNEVLVGYADFGFSPAKVRAARSTDGGLTFGSDMVLANNSVGGNGACPVIDAAGNYFMFWRDSFQDSLWVSRSTDEGASWSADRGIVAMNPLPSTLPGGFRIVNLPSADADPLTGSLVVVWNDQLFGNPDVLSIRSTDGGTTWSAPVRVNDDAGSNAQWFPWIAIDESGIVHVTWYDRRQNGSDIDVYYAHSTDGGVTYEANIRVTAQSFPPVLPWDTSLDFIGDYNGIAAANGLAYPFYQDAREGNQDVYVATIPSSQVAVPSAGTGARVRTRLAAAPSPFVGSVSIEADAALAGAVVELFSVEGRLVRTLTLGAPARATWDGRDATGRDLPSGVYFARVSGRAVDPVRLVKMR